MEIVVKVVSYHEWVEISPTFCLQKSTKLLTYIVKPQPSGLKLLNASLRDHLWCIFIQMPEQTKNITDR